MASESQLGWKPAPEGAACRLPAALQVARPPSCWRSCLRFTGVFSAKSCGPLSADNYLERSTVAEQRLHNIHVRDEIYEAAFVRMRRFRDATLAVPALMLPAVQVNIRRGSSRRRKRTACATCAFHSTSSKPAAIRCVVGGVQVEEPSPLGSLLTSQRDLDSRAGLARSMPGRLPAWARSRRVPGTRLPTVLAVVATP